MTSNHGNNDDDERKDLTHIGELPEFMHVDDTDVDLQFGKTNQAEENEDNELVNLDELDAEASFDSLPDLPAEPENESEFLAETEIETETDSFLSSTDEEFAPMETNFFDDSNNTFDNTETLDESISEFSFEPESEPDTESESESESESEKINETPFQARENFNLAQEKFEDVKNFAQNFSYGTIEGAGNPPFTIIARNILSTDDAEDIKILLKEFGIINDNNLSDFDNALAIGSIIIPQISEFTAIVLAHKLRKFDLDLEVGLSDEIHPSKSGEVNPRGLTKRNQINQNKEESFKRTEQVRNINELLISTTNSIEGYQITQYLGVLHTHTFIDEEELDRLSFINKNLRANEANAEDQSIYEKYKKSFNKIHDDLLDELKSIAFKDGANALLGVQFSMTPLHDSKKNQYQISCSCTKAVASRHL